MDKITNAEMLNPKNIVLTALFSILWAIVKYLPSPWFNSTRYVILKMFCKKNSFQIHWRKCDSVVSMEY